MVDTTISTPTTPRPSSVLLSEVLPQHLLDWAAPADMLQYLSSPDCVFTSEEKAYIYKEIIAKSVLAFDAETGLSRFLWIHSRIAAMDESAKAATLLHSDYTIAMLCKAFLASLDADGMSFDFGHCHEGLCSRHCWSGARSCRIGVEQNQFSPAGFVGGTCIQKAVQATRARGGSRDPRFDSKGARTRQPRHQAPR